MAVLYKLYTLMCIAACFVAPVSKSILCLLYFIPCQCALNTSPTYAILLQPSPPNFLVVHFLSHTVGAKIALVV
jgi:hypothetical protein